MKNKNEKKTKGHRSVWATQGNNINRLARCLQTEWERWKKQLDTYN